MNTSNKYYINRIRLINFHNFTDELVDIKDGGHLFILGDNGSGKTTLLDAVHYVLTAGESLELNSAARIAGSKAGGRRVQDIITRYNIDTGHLNPEGAITYAAIEIIGRNTKPFVAAIGMMVNSPNDNIKRWGIIKSGCLEDIPFIKEDMMGSRPLTGQEMKKAIGSNYCFLQLQRYKNVLSDRVFGSLEQFAEFCRFLKIGKAYREIAAQATDYHELFKKLLPTPGVERFERVIESLNTLDSSRDEIENLKEKRNFINNLVELSNDLKYKKKLIAAFECMKLEFEITDILDVLELKKREQIKLNEQLNDIKRNIEKYVAEKTGHEKLLDDYKQKDSSGLVRQESELRARIKEFSDEVTKLEILILAKTQQEKSILEKSEKVHSIIVIEIKKTFILLSELSSELQFSIGELTAVFEKCLHIDATDEIVDIISKIDFIKYQELYTEHSTETIVELRDKENIVKSQLSEIKSIEDEINKLKNKEEAIPFIDNFSEAAEELRMNMIKARPIYLGLEWGTGITDDEINFIEEIIGEKILASFIINDKQYEDAVELIINDNFSGIRLFSEKELFEDNTEVPAWINKYFSLKNSDPHSIKALILAMYSQKEPEFDIKNEILAFRGHRRHLTGSDAYLIGEKNRKRQIKKQIADLNIDLKEYKAALNTSEEEFKIVKLKKKKLDSYNSLLKRCEIFINRGIKEHQASSLELKHCREIIELNQSSYNENKSTLDFSKNRLIDIVNIISKEGLHNLEEKINSTINIIKKHEETIGNCRVENGKKEQLLEEVDEFIKAKSNELETLKKTFKAKANGFQNDFPEVGDVSEYLKELRHLERVNSLNKYNTVIGKYTNDCIEQKTILNERIRDKKYGMQYGFTYYEESNILTDRQGRSVYDILKRYDLDIKDQQEIINDKTSELFKKIIMDDLVRFLKERISHIEDMEKNINQILGKREFGNNRYNLKIKPIDKYKNFVKIIKTYSPLNEDIEKELKDFFDYYKHDIVDTEPGEIPEILDYRNWYSYEMLVKTPDSNGKVLNKYVKNIGSGGEQAVPNYLLILTIAHFIYNGSNIKLPILLFDEAFYGIDSGRRDQLMGFAGDIGLQIIVATPDQDGVKQEIMYSTSLFIKKDNEYNIHIQPVYWTNPDGDKQTKFEFVEEADSIEIGSVQ